MKNILKKIKKTFFWKITIEYFFYPIIYFFWSYILNFEAKILYLFWSLKKKKHYDLKKNDKKLICENPVFQNLARKILDESTTHTEESKKEILSKEYQEILSSHVSINTISFHLCKMTLTSSFTYHIVHTSCSMLKACKHAYVFT